MDNFEVWKDIVGYEGHYQVSSIGRVKSLARVVESRKGIFGNKKESFLKATKNKKGYLNLKLCIKKDEVCSEKSVIVHRLVANEFLENPLNKPKVNHKNGIKDDNRVNNLEWCTGSENVIHALANNLKISQKGSEHGNSKLTEEKVLEIRKIGRSKTLKEVAKIYNVDISLISLVLLNKIWKHV
ncbi:MAG: NUMOD4 domain-containing protein [Flavobacterium sp.]